MENTVRTAVYEATVMVLLENGLKGLKMRLVAKEAGIATGTLYNYFKDKDDLLFYVYQEVFNDFFAHLSQAADCQISPVDKLSDVVKKYFEFVVKNIDLFKFLAETNIFQRAHKTIFREHGEKCVGIFEKILDEGIGQGLFKKCQVSQTAGIFHGSIIGVLKTKAERDVLQPKEDAKSLVEMFNAHLGIEI